MNPENVWAKIVSDTRAYFKQAGCQKAVIGLSGGLDSSLTAYVLVDALGKDNVTGLLMPDSSVNNSSHHSDAIAITKTLGISFQDIPIDGIVEAFEKSLKWEESSLARMNLRARARMVVLYDFANSTNALVVGTSNKSELLLGYFTKHGDGATDLLPLRNLFKTEVFALAKSKGLPKNIIEKKPSPGLVSGQTDETDLGASYEEIDPILKEIEKGKSEKQLKKEFKPELVSSLIERMRATGHKRSGLSWQK